MKKLLSLLLFCVSFAAHAQFTTGQVLRAADLNAAFTFTQSGAGAVPRAFSDKARESVSVKDFGAVGNGVTDDTAAIGKALAYVKASGGTLTVPSSPGGYLINNLHVPTGVKILGTGGDAGEFGSYWYSTGGNGGNYDQVSKQASVFRVASGGVGITVDSDAGSGTSAGAHLENIAIEGPESGGAAFGLKINGFGVSTTNVTVNRFPDGVGVEMGFHWRARHDRLHIRNSGIGLYFNGNTGAVNGVAFNGLMIEECVVGIYHVGASGGLPSTANTFTSPIIEAIRRRAGLAWPPTVTLDSQFKIDSGMTESTVVAGVLMGTDAHFTFVGLYTELVNGIHMYLNTNATVNIFGGHLEMDTGGTSETYSGKRFVLHRGKASVIGAEVVYDKTKTDPLFTVNLYTSFVFQGNTFSGLRSERPYYVDGYGQTFPEGYSRGAYQEADGQPLFMSPSLAVMGYMSAKTLTMQQYNYGVIQTNAAVTYDLADSDYPTRLLVSNIYDGATHPLTITYSNVANVKNGQRLTVINKVFTSKTGEGVTISFGANLRATPVTASYASASAMNYIISTDFVFSEGAWTQVGQSKLGL